MHDCPQFIDTLDFFFSPEENLNLIDSYFPGFNFQNKVVLDAGCRNGALTQAFFKLGAKAVGVDINEKAILKARSTYMGPKFFKANISNLVDFKDNTFDIVFCSGTLPYLDELGVQEAIREFKRVLKPNGLILVVFQKDKTLFFTQLVKIYNLAPKIFSPILNLLAQLYFKARDRKYIRYALLNGLIGINFGYPFNLLNFEVPTPDCQMISSRFSKSFLLGKL